MKIGFSTKPVTYQSPPDPLFSTSLSYLFLLKNCPRDRGNYNHPQYQEMKKMAIKNAQMEIENDPNMSAMEKLEAYQKIDEALSDDVTKLQISCS